MTRPELVGAVRKFLSECTDKERRAVVALCGIQLSDVCATPFMAERVTINVHDASWKGSRVLGTTDLDWPTPRPVTISVKK